MGAKIKKLLSFVFILFFVFAITSPFSVSAGPVSEGDPDAYYSTPEADAAATAAADAVVAATGDSCQAKRESATAAGNVYYCLFNLTCSQKNALPCWIGYAYGWAQGAVLLLAVGAVVLAGIIYTLSAGDPKRVTLSKKLIIGALSGVAVLVLGRFFLTKIIGVPWL